MKTSNASELAPTAVFRRPRASTVPAQAPDPATTQPSTFVLARRFRDLEGRQQRCEEMLAHVCLLLEEVRDKVDVLGGAADGPGFSLPGPTIWRKARPLPWWQRWAYAVFAPWRLRAPHPEALLELPEERVEIRPRGAAETAEV